jgi:hypothetical protein
LGEALTTPHRKNLPCYKLFTNSSGKRRDIHLVLVAKPEGKRKLERPGHKWEDNIKTNLQEVGCGMDWFDLGQGRGRCLVVMNAAMNLRVS